MNIQFQTYFSGLQTFHTITFKPIRVKHWLAIFQFTDKGKGNHSVPCRTHQEHIARLMTPLHSPALGHLLLV